MDLALPSLGAPYAVIICFLPYFLPEGEKFNKKTCRVDRVANHVTLGRQLSALVARPQKGAKKGPATCSLDRKVTLGGSTGEKKPEPAAEGGKKGKKGKSKESNSPAWLKEKRRKKSLLSRAL